MGTKEIKTAEWVLWVLIAIIGVALLFLGVRTILMQGSVVVSTMFLVVGVILIFVGLIMLLGKANVIVLSKNEKEKKEIKE